MSLLKIRSAAEQVADHLREDLLRGTWGGTMPGEDRLVAALGVGRDTMKAALRHLEEEGLLVGQGKGRRRMIVLPESGRQVNSLRLGILPGLPRDLRLDYIVDLQHLLTENGHSVIFPDRAISELGMNEKRIANLAKETQADAWVVVGGSRDVLNWFAEQPAPAFALFGRRHGLDIPGIGPDKAAAYRSVVRGLLRLGHRRIALLARPVRRLPEPGFPERAFLEELETAGIETSTYNLPDWDGTIESLHHRLDSMFDLTPPTALIIDEPPLFFSVKDYLSRRGIVAPQHVSLVCTDGDPYFDSLRPSVAHINWDNRPLVRRIVNWADGVAQGKKDTRQTLTKTDFVEGGSIGPAP